MRGMKFFLRAITSIFLLLALFWFLDWRQTLTLFRQIDFLPLFLALPLFPFGLWLSAEKWRLLLQAHHVEVGSWKLFKLYWVGVFLSNFLPSSIGGDVSRLAFMRETGRLAEVAASIVMERLTGFAVLLALAALSMVCGGEFFQDTNLEYILWLLVAGGGVVLCLAVFCGDSLLCWVDTFFEGKEGLVSRLIVKGKKVTKALILYRGRCGVLLSCLFLSLVFYLLTIVALFLFFCALGIHIEFSRVFLIAPLITLISSLPISVNSLGLTEGAFVLLFSLVGVPAEECLAVALLARFVQILLSSFGGVFLLDSKLKKPWVA
jgi:uncharacterized protein (TIRG00374 family)